MFWNILIGLALMIIGYLIQPKPKTSQPMEMSELEGPTADGATPIIKIFGDITVKSGNILWFGNVANVKKKRKSGKK